MTKVAPLVAALQDLCKREGGHEFVADKAHVSAANLWQILNGIKLPTGRPRGIGPGLRDKITAAYPDWLDAKAPKSPEPRPAGFSTLALELAGYFDEMLPEDRVLRARALSAATNAIFDTLRASEQNEAPAVTPTPEKQP